MARPHQLLPLLLLLAVPAHAAGDWFSSMHTEGGIELRADPRVFTLFALFNAMGYDGAPLTRREPLPAPRFHPVRARVRARVAQGPGEVRAAADAFFDAHPLPLERYLAATLRGPQPPFGQGGERPQGGELAGLESLLGTAYTRWALGDLLAEVHGEYRRALRGFLPALDAPMGRARELLKVPAGRSLPVVVMNLLEAQGMVRGVMGDGEVVLVVGPGDAPDVEPLVREYARVLVGPVVARKAASWAGGPGLLREARALGASEQRPAEYATALFTRALALKALGAPDAAYDAAAQQGYFGLRDIARGYDDSRGVDAWALEALGRAETRRPAARK